MIAKREREIVVALCRDLVARGFLAATGGNVALRIDAERFAVTPSAMDYAVMTAADVCVLALADLARVDGDRAPSVESGLHAGVLKKRADCGCSIHTHQPAASAWALIGEPLPIVDPHARRHPRRARRRWSAMRRRAPAGSPARSRRRCGPRSTPI